MNTVSRKPHFGHPAQHFISFETSGRARPFPDAHHYERMSMRCKWQGVHCEMGAEWECHVTLLNGAAGGWPGGKDGSVHKGPLKDCKLGTRLALVLLPLHGTAGGGCCLVLTEWRDYIRRIGERRLIITMLHFLQSVDGHYVHSCTYTTVLCDLLSSLAHTVYNWQSSKS